MTSPYGPGQQFDPYGRDQYDPDHASAAPAHAAGAAPADAPTGPPGEVPEFYRRAEAPTAAPTPPTTPPPSSSPPPAPSSSSASSNAGADDGDVDFDAWLAEYALKQPHITLFGDRVPIPFDLPLWVTQRIQAGDADLDTMRTMIDALYGDGRAERWINQRGAGSFGLGVVLAWSMLRAQGEKVSFAEATARAEAMAAEAETKAAQTKQLNDRLGAAAAAGTLDSPEARAEAAALEAMRDAGKASSSSSGVPSRPTFDVSTASTAPGWQR